MLYALAFLPTNGVINGFVTLCQEIQSNFNAYFARIFWRYMYWSISSKHSLSRPFSFINLWNMFDKTDQELPITDNSFKEWYWSFPGHLSSCHPSFCKFVSVLKKEEAYVTVSILQHQGGYMVQPPKFKNCRQLP